MFRLGNVLLLFVAATLALPASANAEAFPWRHDLQSAQAEAAQTGKLVLVHFSTTWCGPCKKLERNVFNRADVAQALSSQYVMVKLDADEHTALAKRFGIRGVPTDVIITPQGRKIDSFISPGTAHGYVGRMGKIAAANAPARDVQIAQQNARAAAQRQVQPVIQGMTTARQIAARPAQAVANRAYAGLQEPTYNPAVLPQGRMPQQTTAVANNVTMPVVAPITQVAQVTPMVPAPQQRYTTPVVAQAVPQMPNNFAGRYAQQPVVQQPAVQPMVTQPQMPVANVAPPVARRPVATVVQAPVQPPVQTKQTFGLDGYCPVTLKTSPLSQNDSRRWVKGDPRWGMIHRGQTYLFASEAAKNAFLQSPDDYAPALSGMDPVEAFSQGKLVTGKREFGVWYAGQIFMFSSEQTLSQFSQNPDFYVSGVRQAMTVGKPTTYR